MSNSLPLSTIPKFDGHNWSTWSTGIKAYLQYLGIDDYISTVIESPTDTTALATHEAVMKRASSIVMLTTESSLWYLFGDKTEPKDRYDILKKRYETTGALTAFSFFDKLFGTKFSEGESMIQQLAELDKLRNDANTAGITLTDPHYVLLILRSLPASYSNMYTSLLSTADLSKITPVDVSSRIIDEYTRRSSDPSMAAMKPSASSLPSKQQKFNGECNYCHKKGHKERDCRKKKADAKGKNKATPSVSTLSTTPVAVDNNSILASFYGTSDNKAWMLDSGCTKHMTPNRSEFTTYESINPLPIFLGDFNQTISYIGIGTIIGQTIVNGKPQKIELKNVLHAPDLPCRYFSVTTVLNKGFNVIFAPAEASIQQRDQVLGVGFRKGDHFWIKIDPTPQLNASQPGIPIEIWHQRLGHLNWNALSKIQDHQIVNRRTELAPPCKGCLQGKQHRRSFPSSSTPRATKPLERIHSDLDGPMQTQS